MKALEALLVDATAGDPITGLKWTHKTLRNLSQELQKRGFAIERDTVNRLLRELKYVQRTNRKRLSKTQDPDRDRQMRYVARQRRAFLKAGFPVISVDTKKRELVGNFKNAGRTWRRGRLDVLENDFPSEADVVAIPYGIYDVGRNEALVVVGTSHQTPEFAITAIRRWWLLHGRRQYRPLTEWLIEADCGGANGNDYCAWKWGLQQLADEFGVTITVTHLPTSASKWNPIEHRLFCFVSKNWAGQPLVDYETVLKFIRTTTTDTGLRCWACLDTAEYATGRKISELQRSQINLKPHRVLPKWNYTIEPH